MLELPPILQRFVDELRRERFSVTDQAHDARGFGNGFVELTRSPDERVRLVVDRGLWTIEIALASTWQDPHIVVLALEGGAYVRRALSHEERVLYTHKAISRMPGEPTAQAALLDRVTALHQQAWHDQFGAAHHRSQP